MISIVTETNSEIHLTGHERVPPQHLHIIGYDVKRGYLVLVAFCSRELGSQAYPFETGNHSCAGF